jgi:hypothetical protein
MRCVGFGCFCVLPAKRAVECDARTSCDYPFSLAAGVFNTSPQFEVRVKLPPTLQPQRPKHVNWPRTASQSAQVEAAW